MTPTSLLLGKSDEGSQWKKGYYNDFIDKFDISMLDKEIFNFLLDENYLRSW